MPERRKIGEILRGYGVDNSEVSSAIRESKKRTGYYLASKEIGEGGRISLQRIVDALGEQNPHWKRGSIRDLYPFEFRGMRIPARYYSPLWEEWQVLLLKIDEIKKEIVVASIDPLAPDSEKEYFRELYHEVRKHVDSIVSAADIVNYEIKIVLVPQATMMVYLDHLGDSDNRRRILGGPLL